MNEQRLLKVVASFIRAKAEEVADPDVGNKHWQQEMARFTEDDTDLPVPSSYSQIADLGNSGVIR